MIQKEFFSNRKSASHACALLFVSTRRRQGEVDAVNQHSFPAIASSMGMWGGPQIKKGKGCNYRSLGTRRVAGDWKRARQAAPTASMINKGAVQRARPGIISFRFPYPSLSPEIVSRVSFRKRDNRGRAPFKKALPFSGNRPRSRKYSCVTDRFHPSG